MNKYTFFLGVILLIVISAVSYRYSWLGKTCLTGGCYGPLKMQLKTTTGEHVEDIVIEVGLRGPGELICLHGRCRVDIYEERLLVDTDEEIIFPRGFC